MKQKKDDYSIRKESCFWHDGHDSGCGVWISTELGLLALGGVILLCIIYSLYWLLTSRKREQVAFEAENSCPLVKERRSGSIFLSIAVEHSQILIDIVLQEKYV